MTNFFKKNLALIAASMIFCSAYAQDDQSNVHVLADDQSSSFSEEQVELDDLQGETSPDLFVETFIKRHRELSLEFDAAIENKDVCLALCKLKQLFDLKTGIMLGFASELDWIDESFDSDALTQGNAAYIEGLFGFEVFKKLPQRKK